MKKILFLQVKSNSIGGVWFVNKTLGHEFIKRGYQVELATIRRCPGPDLVNEEQIKTNCMNEKDKWEITHFQDILPYLKKGNIVKFCEGFLKKVKEEILLKKDYLKMKKFIYKYDPDYIISTHYQLLDAIPKKYLKRTLNEQHTSFKITKEDKKNIKIFNKYKNKIKFIWLSETTCSDAISFGYKNSDYVYNPVKFSCDQVANVESNKKLIMVTRLTFEKGIYTILNIANKLFSDSKYKDWSLEIYGEGNIIEELKKNIKYKKQIKLMGHTTDVLDAYLNSSINLNTSYFEGFPMTILEGNECGVPTITFNYGESVYDLIKNNKTGIVIEGRDEDIYLEKLKELMINSDKLKKMSLQCKKFNKKFNINSIIEKWEEFFKEIDKR